MKRPKRPNLKKRKKKKAKKKTPAAKVELQSVNASEHVKAILKLLDTYSAYDRHTLFRDCVTAIAISLSNAVDKQHYEKREKQYMDLVDKHGAEVMGQFAKVLSHIVMGLEAETCDLLGQVFNELEVSNKHAGQFFTPYSLSKLMAEMTAGDYAAERIAERGYITVNEPASGSGSSLIALIETLRKQGHDTSQVLYIEATDVDFRCVAMAYIQLCLLDVPAKVIHGNTLTMETHSVWYTTRYYWGAWALRNPVAPENNSL